MRTSLVPPYNSPNESHYRRLVVEAFLTFAGMLGDCWRTAESLMRIVMICSMLLVFASRAAAVPITFIHTGSGSGTIGSTPFFDVSFTITSVGDTAGIRSGLPEVILLVHSSSSIAISGVGTFSIKTDTNTFVNHFSSLVGYGRADGADLFDGPFDPAFATWEMLSSIGPIAGEVHLFQWDLLPQIETDGGILWFESSRGQGTFQAIVPEPTSWTATILGLACLLTNSGYRRRGRWSGPAIWP